MQWRHLQELNETYSEHAGHAVWIAGQLSVAVLALLIHALLPDLLVREASKRLEAVERYRRERGNFNR